MIINDYYDICPVCGSPFLRISNSQKFCSAICRKVKRKVNNTGTEEKRTKKKTNIEADIKRADAMGISYGYYMALYGGKA